MKVIAHVLLALACGCAPRDAGPDRRRAPRPKIGPVPAQVADALASTRLVNVPAGTFGPYLGLSTSSALAVWIAVDDKGKRSFFSAAIGDDPKPLGEPVRVADAQGDVGLVAVRPGGGRGGKELDAPGFVVLSTHRTGGVSSIEALTLGARGELRGGSTSLAQPEGDVVWIEGMSSAQGTLVFWAIRKEDRADLYAVALGPNGEKLAAPELVARNARAWQAVAIDGRAALGVVRHSEGRAAIGPVDVVFVSQRARVEGAPVVVSSQPTAELDLDMAAIGERVVLAWSDRRRFEPELYVAAVDSRGALVSPPAPATPALGEQALVRLVPPLSPQGPAYLAWENLMHRPRRGRHIEVAPLNADAKLSEGRARLHFASEEGAVPELVASARGLAALTLAPDCEHGKACTDRSVVPTFVELSSGLDVIASEPMRLSVLGGEIAPLAWALGCRASGCLSLAALGDTPAPVFAVRLEARSKRWQAAAERVKPAPPPRVASIEAVAAPDPLSEVSAARVGGSTLVAYVTHFDPTTPYARLKKPAPDGRYEPLRALLEVRSLPDEGEPRPPNAVSLRARSIAGVALAPGAAEQREALLVWGALDNARPQLFATLLAEDGKTVKKRMLTRTGGEVSDVAAAFVGDGYLVAWVDERHDNPEVYVMKVDRALRQLGPERRLTQAPGAATGVTLLPRGKEVFVAWADAREGEQPGWADIWSARLRASDAAPLAEEQRLARTRPHSHSPALAGLGNGVAVAWIEEQPDSALTTRGTGFRIARLEADGRLLDAPDKVQGTSGSPTSLALECADAACHVVLSVDIGDRSELHAVRWAPGEPPLIVPLVTLTGPHGQAVSPVLLGRQIFYADQAVGEQGRVRKLLMDWQ